MRRAALVMACLGLAACLRFSRLGAACGDEGVDACGPNAVCVEGFCELAGSDAGPRICERAKLASPFSGQATQYLAVGDLNGDGAPEVVGANVASAGRGRYTVYWAQPDGGYRAEMRTNDEDLIFGLALEPNKNLFFAGPTRLSVVAAVDGGLEALPPLDSAGAPQGGTALTLLNATLGPGPLRRLHHIGPAGLIRTWAETSTNTFAAPSNFTLPGCGASPCTGAVMAELNADSSADLVIGQPSTGLLFAFEGTDGGLSASPQSVSIGGPVGGNVALPLTAARLDRRGARDVVIASADGGIVIAQFDGGGFVVGEPIAVARGSQTITTVVAGDFDHNGTVDVLVGSSSPNLLSFMAGDGEGHLAAPIEYPLGTRVVPIKVLVADLNQDGELDLIIGVGAPDPWVYLSGGTGCPLFQPDGGGGLLGVAAP